MAEELTDKTFHKKLDYSGLIVIDFYASWCQPCKYIAPIIREISAMYFGKASVCTLDTETNPITGQMLNVENIPTIMLIKDRKIVDKVSGVTDDFKERLITVINKHL